MEDPGVMQSMGSQKAGSDLVTEQQQIQFYIKIIFFNYSHYIKVITVDVDLEMYEKPRAPLIQGKLENWTKSFYSLNHTLNNA